jgi:uncharacterized protein YjbI with pentapeptide repeats
MKASEVLKRYAAGERNFCRADLRGQSFKGQNFSGANFSEADIREANFTHAILRGANFSKVKTGIGEYWTLFNKSLCTAPITVIGSLFLFLCNEGKLRLLTPIGDFLDNLVYGEPQSPSFEWRIATVVTIFELIRLTLSFLPIQGVTKFRGADLADANFSEASLDENTDFRHTKRRRTILDRVCWQDAKIAPTSIHGEQCRGFGGYDGSILQQPMVRELLVTRNGYRKSYVYNILYGANLDGSNLVEANLERADLRGATLRDADLRGANLTEATVRGADFTGASLTGICLEGWNADHTTTLKNVDCQYVYLQQNQQERRPLVGDFASGDFEKVYTTFGETLDFLFRQGSDPVAFRTALAQLLQNNPNAEIKGLSKLSDELLNVSIEGIPKPEQLEVARTFKLTESSIAEQRLQETLQRNAYLEGENQAQLRQIDDQKGLIKGLIDNQMEAIKEMAEASKAPKYDLRNANVGGIADNVHGSQNNTQNNQATEQNFDMLLADFKQFIDTIQAKYPTLEDKATIAQIIDDGAKLIEVQDHRRWQNFLNLKRLWNGGKKATFKVGEHFAEQNPWYKAAIAFLEGVSEEVK